MQEKHSMPKQKRRTKKACAIARLEALGDDLVSHLTKIGSTWDDFCSFLTPAREETPLDTKRLRDFIAAYHELSRALLDVQPPDREKKEDSPAVVILPDVQDE